MAWDHRGHREVARRGHRRTMRRQQRPDVWSNSSTESTTSLRSRADIGRTRVSRERCAAAVIVLLGACSTGPPQGLDDADQVRVAAVVEASVASPRHGLCLAVDARTLRGPVTGPSAFAGACDPTASLMAAVSHVGSIYPQSQCVPVKSAAGSTTVSRRGSGRPAVLVTLGAVRLSDDDASAHLELTTWSGELSGQTSTLRYRKVGTAWQLDRRDVTFQE